MKATGDGIVFGLERVAVDLEASGEVHGITVDGRDIKLDGWSWANGEIDGSTSGSITHFDPEKYGWSVFWKGDAEDDQWNEQLEHIPWDDF